MPPHFDPALGPKNLTPEQRIWARRSTKSFRTLYRVVRDNQNKNDHPGATSSELCEALSEKLGRKVTLLQMRPMLTRLKEARCIQKSVEVRPNESESESESENDTDSLMYEWTICGPFKRYIKSCLKKKPKKAATLLREMLAEVRKIANTRPPKAKSRKDLHALCNRIEQDLRKA